MKLDNERIVNVPDINFVYRKKLRKLFTSNFHIVCVCVSVDSTSNENSFLVCFYNFMGGQMVSTSVVYVRMVRWPSQVQSDSYTNNISKQTSRISELFVEFRYASLHTRLIHEGDRFLVLCYRSSSYYLDV